MPYTLKSALTLSHWAQLALGVSLVIAGFFLCFGVDECQRQWGRVITGKNGEYLWYNFRTMKYEYAPGKIEDLDDEQIHDYIPTEAARRQYDFYRVGQKRGKLDALLSALMQFQEVQDDVHENKTRARD